MVVDNPVEDCEMDPIRTCKFVTKLVPKLTAKETCMDVPKEICSKSRGNPRRVKKPLIKTWCFKPEKKSQSGVVLEPEDGDCTQCVEGISGVCDIQHTPYTQCKYCVKDVCVTGMCHTAAFPIHILLNTFTMTNTVRLKQLNYIARLLIYNECYIRI